MNPGIIINAASGGAEGNYWSSLEELRKIDFWAVKEMMSEHDAALYWTVACRLINQSIEQARINPNEPRGLDPNRKLS